MRRKRVILSLVALVALGAWLLSAVPVRAQQNTLYRAPRTADGQPDLNGIWQALNTANWDLEEHGAEPAPLPDLLGAYLAQPGGLSVVEGGTIPYTPEGLAQRTRNLESRLDPDPLTANDEGYPMADPEAKCFGAVPPRAAYMPFPFQIVQGKEMILLGYEYAGTPRLVYLSDVDDNLFYGVITWSGQSRGHWEGDTLVVEVQGFSGHPWLDRAGNFMSLDATVVERYTPISPNHLLYEATIEDPNVFTRPWKLSMPLYRRIEPNAQLMEFECVALVEEFLYNELVKPSSE